MSEEKQFTQVEVDDIVQERLRRSKRSDERALEKAKEEAVAELPNYKTIYFDALRKIKLVDAGLTLEQAEHYAKYVTASDEKEIEAQAEDIAKDVLASQKQTFADPSSRRNSVWNPWN